MKKHTFPLLVLAGAFCALPTHADDRQIDWNTVPGTHGRNDVSKDFIAAPNPLNDVLSNSFTAWEPRQNIIAQARTTTGRAQRMAVLSRPAENTTASTVSYTSETVVTTQAAPTQENQPLYSEGANAAGNQAQANTQAQTNTEAETGAQAENRESTKTASVSPEAKAQLAPHALMIQSSLHSAMDQVRGMKGELGVTKDMEKADKSAVKTYNAFIREVKNDINIARKHEKELATSVRRFPDIAQSDEFRSLNPALTDLQSSLKSWESKASKASYWNDQQQAAADLNKIEKQLNNAFNTVKTFSTDKLDASLG